MRAIEDGIEICVPVGTRRDMPTERLPIMARSLNNNLPVRATDVTLRE